MINSISQSPAFGKGQKVYLYVDAGAKNAVKAVKAAFSDKAYKVSAVTDGPKPILKNLTKVEVECPNGWGKAERDILWNNLIGGNVVEENGAKKVVYNGLSTFVSMA